MLSSLAQISKTWLREFEHVMAQIGGWPALYGSNWTKSIPFESVNSRLMQLLVPPVSVIAHASALCAGSGDCLWGKNGSMYLNDVLLL